MRMIIAKKYFQQISTRIDEDSTWKPSISKSKIFYSKRRTFNMKRKTFNMKRKTFGFVATRDGKPASLFTSSRSMKSDNPGGGGARDPGPLERQRGAEAHKESNGPNETYDSLCTTTNRPPICHRAQRPHSPTNTATLRSCVVYGHIDVYPTTTVRGHGLWKSIGNMRFFSVAGE